MENLSAMLTTATNLGGMGLLSVALFFLHREALKVFAAELKCERESAKEMADAEREQCRAMNAAILERLDSHTKVILDEHKLHREVTEGLRRAFEMRHRGDFHD